MSWTAPHTGTFRFDTFGSDADTVLYVREGGCFGTELACNDDTGGVFQSEVIVSLAAGESVAVFIDSYDDSSADVVQLNITAAERCANGVDDASVRQPDFMARANFGRDRRKAWFQILDVAVAKLLDEPLAKPLPVDQARAGKIEVEVAKNTAAG